MKKTTYLKCIILTSMLILGIMATFPLVSADKQGIRSDHNGSSFGQPVIVSGAAGGSPSITEAQGLGPAGDSGSGWKTDIKVTNSYNNSVNPSMSTYVNSTTGAVILYAAMQFWTQWNVTGRWEVRIYRSTNGGNTWGYWWHGWWQSERSMINPSLAVSSYNGSVFLAVQSVAFGGFSNDIHVWRINPNNGNDWQFYGVVGTVDEEINPHLVAEYGYGSGDWLYLSYETGLNPSFRSVYFARSTNWGQTWTTSTIATWAFPTYIQSCITYAQGNLYIAYRESGPSYADTGWIDVAYSTNFGSTWKYAYNASGVSADASQPSIAGARAGIWNQPTTLIIAYEYNTTSGDHDIYYTYSLDYGATWTGGSDVYHQIATSTGYEEQPKLAVDGIGTENTNVGGNYHLIYEINSLDDLYYTQLPYFDIPVYYGGHAFWGYYFGWSTPHGKITDTAAWVSANYRVPAITTYPRMVGGVNIWEPGVAWTDLRGTFYDIFYSTPGTDFSLSFAPSSQTVVAGKAINYRITVNLLGGTTATAYMGGSQHWPSYMSIYVTMAYNVATVTPTGMATLTLTTSNLLPAGNYQLTATATIGGYRRMIQIPYVVVAPPSLTLNVSPTTVARGQPVTLSGQLSPALGTPQTIYIYYRYPHQVGTWKLATTLSTNAAGAYTVTAAVPNSLPAGAYDLVAFWVNTATGSYATSPIVFWTVT